MTSLYDSRKTDSKKYVFICYAFVRDEMLLTLILYLCCATTPSHQPRQCSSWASIALHIHSILLSNNVLHLKIAT